MGHLKMMLWVAAGGAIGASARYTVGTLATHLTHGHFPWGTFTVNTVGSFILGVLAGVMAYAWTPSNEIRSLIVVGGLGAFTTFSSFSLDAVLLMERGRIGLSAVYMLSTFVLAVGGLFVGLRLMRLVLT